MESLSPLRVTAGVRHASASRSAGAHQATIGATFDCPPATTREGFDEDTIAQIPRPVDERGLTECEAPAVRRAEPVATEPDRVDAADVGFGRSRRSCGAGLGQTGFVGDHHQLGAIASL